MNRSVSAIWGSKNVRKVSQTPYYGYRQILVSLRAQMRGSTGDDLGATAFTWPAPGSGSGRLRWVCCRRSSWRGRVWRGTGMRGSLRSATRPAAAPAGPASWRCQRARLGVLLELQLARLAHLLHLADQPALEFCATIRSSSFGILDKSGHSAEAGPVSLTAAAPP